MYISKVKTYTNVGLEGYEITIEVDANRSIPTLEVIGLPDAAIREAKERIRMTFKNSDVPLPNKKIVLNLAPSDIRKVGTRFDLPMAMAILMLLEGVRPDLNEVVDRSLFFGELGLDGSVKRVQGLLPSVIAAYRKGRKYFFVPEENIPELQYIPNISFVPLTNFLQLVEFVQGSKELPSIQGNKESALEKRDHMSYGVDFQEIKGHVVPKRALTVAAAGMHNVLMSGPPGSGKTMLAKALQSILPPLHFDEIIEVSQLYSLVGKLHKDHPLILKRPFRAVHHTASKISIVGGGKHMTPGEISLAHLGILFFDELPEFPREVLEVLRQPIEDKVITISRAQGSVMYPADFMFVATMNPCKCGYYKDRAKDCICSLHDIKRYQSKVSGPLLDRFDMVLEVPRENIDMILEKEQSENSESIRKTVVQAWEIQQHRYKETSYTTNAQLGVKAIQQYIRLCDEVELFLKTAVKQLHLSPRVMHRMMKLARSIADIDGSETISQQHMAEALQYRAKSMFVE